MKLIFFEEYIQGNEILFWSYVALMLIIIILTVIFVRKELKKWIYH